MNDFADENKSNLFKPRCRVKRFFYAALLAFGSALPGLAQELTDDIAPPPLKIISKEERKLLNAETDLKKRLLLSVGFLERHTSQAEVYTSDNHFEDALAELGNFEAVLIEALQTLSKGNPESRKVQTGAKMMEAALRKFSARLELMRRKMPFTYSYHVQKLIKVVREARGKAIEPFWGEVIPQKTKN